MPAAATAVLRDRRRASTILREGCLPANGPERRDSDHSDGGRGSGDPKEEFRQDGLNHI